MSIFGIVAIGVGFFAGIKGAAPDMRTTADTYYDDNGLMDFRLVSTYGFDEKDIAALKEIAGAEVFPSYYIDLLSNCEGSSPSASRLFALNASYNDLNAITLAEGRMPVNEKECLINVSDMKGGPSVGETVIFTDSDGKAPDDIISVNEYTIVGSYMTPQYIDKTSRGSTNIGNGSINAVYLIPEGNFSVEYNTEVYIRFPELVEFNCYEEDYIEKTEAFSEIIEKIAERRETERYDEIMSEAYDKINDAKEELEDAKAELEKELADGEKELSDAKDKLDEVAGEIEKGEQEIADADKELQDGKQELENAKDEYNDKISEAEKEIADGWAEIEKNEEQLIDAEKQLEQAKKDYEDGLQQYEDGVVQYEEGLVAYEEGYTQWLDGKAQYDEGYAQWEEGKEQLDTLKSLLDYYKGIVDRLGESVGTESPLYTAALETYNETYAQYEENAKLVEDGKAELDKAKAELDKGEKELADSKVLIDETAALLESTKIQLDEAAVQLDEGEKEIAEGKALLLEAKQQLIAGEKELNDQKAQAEKEFSDAEKELADGESQLNDAKNEFEDGKQQYEDGLKEYEDGEQKLEDGKKEAEEKIAEAEKEIADAEAELKDLEKPSWYLFTRDDNPGYTEYGQNAERINNIASVFPVFFLVVAALVCLTTMSRMVEEQRTQIGTLKALGYSNADIMFKYMVYALSATVSGALAGVLIGMHLFPFVIITAYGIMYDLPGAILIIDVPIALTAMLVFIVGIGITVLFTCRSALSEQSAQLMRPKAPKVGKKILLERIKPVWKLFGFSSKVTARNIFRYKRKMLMTVIGISGCTALLLTGFALYDSINDIISLQYGELIKYDGMVVYDEEKYPESDDKTAEILSAHGDSINVFQKLTTVTYGSGSAEAYIVVPKQADIYSDFHILRDRITKEEIELKDGTVYINEKLGTLLGGVAAGEKIELSKSDTEHITVEVSSLFENYPSHYVYMTEATYEEAFGEKPVYNSLYFRHDLETDEESGLAEELLKTEGVLAVSFNSDVMNNFDGMLSALDYVIIVVIASAGVLAFIVMYNLTNINITERIREIATLKVLGFYDGEVDSYIFRENIILSILGTLFGLGLGTWLANFIITTAEVDLVMFGRNIYPMSYVLAGIMTILFSVLVTVVMHGRLKNVDMIEALKSVE